MNDEFIIKKEDVKEEDLVRWEIESRSAKLHLTPAQEIINAHEFLKQFIAKFDTAKRGGVHDFIEIALFNMVSEAIQAINVYLKPGYHHVDAAAVTTVAVDAFQKVLDRIKRNLEDIEGVVLK
jgi:hypothetical protein